jgi:protein gp37
MADKSAIEWTDATWSPVTGCDPISAGCKHCYAKREVETRWSKNPKSEWFGRPFNDVRCHPEKLAGARSPLTWKRPRRIFVCPRADLFHEAVPVEFIAQVFAVMARCPQHTFQVLTKRARRMQFVLWSELDWEPLPNVWLGVSVEDQDTANTRIPLLLQTPAALRWISAEPLLGKVDLSRWLSANALHEIDGGPRVGWIVAGGESGPKARPMQGDWARGLRDQCAAAGVPFLFKQWGEWIDADQADNEAKDALWRNRSHFEMRDAGLIADIPPKPPGPPHFACNYTIRLKKKAAGRLLDGVLHDEYPEARR